MKKLEEATGPGRYILNQPGNGSRPIFINDPQIRVGGWGANLMKVRGGGHPIDIDSDLIGLTRPLTKSCIEGQYPNKGTVYSQKGDFCTLKAPFTKQSRATHPVWMYRDLEQSNRHPLFLASEYSKSHQAADVPFHSYLNTRILEKDNFKPKIPCPFD